MNLDSDSDFMLPDTIQQLSLGEACIIEAPNAQFIIVFNFSSDTMFLIFQIPLKLFYATMGR
jgi:hypothetical protein